MPQVSSRGWINMASVALGLGMAWSTVASAQIPPPPFMQQGQPGPVVVTVPVPPPPFMQGMSGMAGLATDPAINPPSGQATESPTPMAGSVAEPATAPAQGQEATAPGNAGSTGWTGGTGGSNIGTNPQGAVATSKTWQPPTARGLDLMGAADPVAKP